MTTISKCSVKHQQAFCNYSFQTFSRAQAGIVCLQFSNVPLRTSRNCVTRVFKCAAKHKQELFDYGFQMFSRAPAFFTIFKCAVEHQQAFCDNISNVQQNTSRNCVTTVFKYAAEH